MNNARENGCRWKHVKENHRHQGVLRQIIYDDNPTSGQKGALIINWVVSDELEMRSDVIYYY